MRTTQQKWLALIYFFVYIFGMFFIMVNIFLSILNDAYAGSKEALEDKQQKEKEEEEAAIAAAGGPRESRAARARRKANALRNVLKGRYDRYKRRVRELARPKASAGAQDF